MLCRLFIYGVIALSLSSCGFQPLLKTSCSSFQEKSPDTQKLHLEIKGEEGYTTYRFRRELQQQLALTPKINNDSYHIIIELKESFADTSYSADATTLRTQVQLTATYTIRRKGQGPAYHQGSVTSFSSFGIDNQEEFLNITARAAIIDRLIIVLAEDVAREIILVLRSLTTGNN